MNVVQNFSALQQNIFPAQRHTRLPGGYMGKILRVDLSQSELLYENLPEEPVLRKLWGGQLLAEYILLHELEIGTEAFGAQSVIVGMTGPITGTGFTPGGTKLNFVYLSPATGYTLGRGATSGFLATALKAAGFDGVIITGAAAQPVYLYVGEDRVELRDASHVWGKGTRATEENLRSEVGHRDAKRGWPSRCEDWLHRTRRRALGSGGYVGERLQSQRGAWFGCGHGIEETQGHRGLGNQAPAAVR